MNSNCSQIVATNGRIIFYKTNGQWVPYLACIGMTFQPIPGYAFDLCPSISQRTTLFGLIQSHCGGAAAPAPVKETEPIARPLITPPAPIEIVSRMISPSVAVLPTVDTVVSVDETSVSFPNPIGEPLEEEEEVYEPGPVETTSSLTESFD